MHVLETELEQRWEDIFSALAAGDDVPPSTRLRTEGLMEAVALQQVATCEALQGAMDRSYQRAFGRGLQDDFGPGWQALFPFPQIPAMMRRAPVYPSTKD